ncbi:hypothetical protein XH99_00690 [Bradyrhizobium nanningense]|uniref:Uncharacterized protein n=1 Tax=Bradyrhizobium nanningense TaxID=1325118 RepID=A0A4Q0SKN5_9BRAD|nr:hypothetical protein [Bradyrhizobium nanningense]RXH38631.1 hypothetical protein XH99_00690 [Bradyrhizobium nanningense]
MTSTDDWLKKQGEPLSLFDLANRWGEALKVVGAGNGAGLIAGGAALATFAKYPNALPLIKAGGVCFFVGVLSFAVGFASLQLAIFSYDAMLHEVRLKKQESVRNLERTIAIAMAGANWLALGSATAFVLGLLFGLRVFLSF